MLIRISFISFFGIPLALCGVALINHKVDRKGGKRRLAVCLLSKTDNRAANRRFLLQRCNKNVLNGFCPLKLCLFPALLRQSETAEEMSSEDVERKMK